MVEKGPYDEINQLAESLKSYSWTIAIDGPAAVGKGTLMNNLKKLLDLDDLPTGDMYRSVTFYLTEVCGLSIQKIEEISDNNLSEILNKMDIAFTSSQNKEVILMDTVLKYGAKVTTFLQNPEIGKIISKIAKRDPVRDYLEQFQKQKASAGNIVMEGRDMWNVVSEQANLMIYKYADDEVLIGREMKRQEDLGKTITYDMARLIVVKRNQDDSNRSRGKLLKPQDAIGSGKYHLIIDTSNMNSDEVALTVLKKLYSVATVNHE